MPAPRPPKVIEAIKHVDDKRKYIPTAEFETNIREEERTPLQVAFERRNKDLDPQLVWRGKDIQDWSDLVVPAPALYIQEKVHPKALIDDLRRQSETTKPGRSDKSILRFQRGPGRRREDRVLSARC